MPSLVSHKLSIIKYVVLKKIFFFLCFDRLIWTWTWTWTRTSLDSDLTRTRTSLDLDLTRTRTSLDLSWTRQRWTWLQPYLQVPLGVTGLTLALTSLQSCPWSHHWRCCLSRRLWESVLGACSERPPAFTQWLLSSSSILSHREEHSGHCSCRSWSWCAITGLWIPDWIEHGECLVCLIDSDIHFNIAVTICCHFATQVDRLLHVRQRCSIYADRSIDCGILPHDFCHDFLLLTFSQCHWYHFCWISWCLWDSRPRSSA